MNITVFCGGVNESSIVARYGRSSHSFSRKSDSSVKAGSRFRSKSTCMSGAGCGSYFSCRLWFWLFRLGFPVPLRKFSVNSVSASACRPSSGGRLSSWVMARTG